MQYYLEAAIVEVIERAKRLKTRFPTPPPLHFQALAQRCLDLIDENISDLKLLHTAPEFQNEANQSTRLKLLKIRIREIDLIENIAVSAITRCIDGDERINKFVQGLKNGTLLVGRYGAIYSYNSAKPMNGALLQNFRWIG